MKEPPWKRLVEELKDEGYESIYLDRLRANLDVEQQHGMRGCQGICAIYLR